MLYSDLSVRPPDSYARLVSALGDLSADNSALVNVPAASVGQPSRLAIAAGLVAIAGIAAAYSAVSSYRRSGSFGQSMAWGAGAAFFPLPSAGVTAILNNRS